MTHISKILNVLKYLVILMQNDPALDSGEIRLLGLHSLLLLISVFRILVQHTKLQHETPLQTKNSMF